MLPISIRIFTYGGCIENRSGFLYLVIRPEEYAVKNDAVINYIVY